MGASTVLRLPGIEISKQLFADSPTNPAKAVDREFDRGQWLSNLVDRKVPLAE